MDSGAFQFMMHDRNALPDFVEIKQPCNIILGDNQTIRAFGKGTYQSTTDIERKPQKIAIYDVLYFPDLRRNSCLYVL